MRSPRYPIILLSLLLFAPCVQAGPGDTLVVQTFTWGWPVNPGWNSPREGKFFFPTAGKQFEKILLYYTLKCDPSQNPPCGEWDYLTYTRLHEGTGVMDSTQLQHPNFQVFGNTPDTLLYMTSPLPSLIPRTERTARYNTISRLDTSVFGAAADVSRTPFALPAGDSRSYLLWTRSELEATGFSSDTLTGMRFRVIGAGGRADRVTIRLKRHTATTWQPDLPLQRTGYTTVYDATLDFPDDDWVSIPFTQGFLIWGGGVLAEISVVGAPGVELAADGGMDGFSTSSGETEALLLFQHRSHVHCGNIPDLDNTQAFTLEAWIKPTTLRNWSNIVIRARNNEHRVGIQTGPVEGGRADVYCLVGNGQNSYAYTSNRPIIEGAWYHLAMVFDGNAANEQDRIRLYVNGAAQTLRLNGNIPEVTASIDAPFTISGPGANSMTGAIDEVRIWNTALTAEDILERMHSSIDAQDPLYTSLIAAWDFNEGSGAVAHDLTGRYHGTLALPEWSSYAGDRPRGYVEQPLRPAMILERGNVTLTHSERTVIDTVMPPPMMVVLYQDTTRANLPTDTLVVWPRGYTYTVNPDNTIRDSVLIPPDGMLIRQNHFYYSAPFEIRRRYELARYITPYGIGLDLGEGWTWVWDVTDFAPLLRDTVHLTAGNFQELLDMRFIFVEGTPPRDVISIENVWQGDFPLNRFAERVQPKRLALHPDARGFKLRTTASGHQFSNPTNCAEFCPKIHSVSVDGQQRWSWQIIQECSMNPLYPQGGTWIYARAGWCPGAESTTKEFELTPFITGDEVEVAYSSQFDEYGNYVFESQFVQYGEPHHQLDAAIDRIIAPSNYELNGRFNPTCGRPRIVIQNRGAQRLQQVEIRYGYRGASQQNYSWQGNLAFMEKAELWLPPLAEMPAGESGIFEVSLHNPNGGVDEYSFNDAQFSHFHSVPVYDRPIVVEFRTNNAAHENRYEVLDAEGTILHSRGGFAANTMYRDTLRLLPGCYEFILHDSDNDGIAWWANNDGTGSLRFRAESGAVLATMNPDFGKQSRYAFRYSALVAVEPPATTTADFELYPNPASNRLTLRRPDQAKHSTSYTIHDMLGQTMLSGSLSTSATDIDISALPSGMYVINIVEGATIRQQKRFNLLR
jgi:hypothetical protein